MRIVDEEDDPPVPHRDRAGKGLARHLLQVRLRSVAAHEQLLGVPRVVAGRLEVWARLQARDAVFQRVDRVPNPVGERMGGVEAAGEGRAGHIVEPA